MVKLRETLFFHIDGSIRDRHGRIKVAANAKMDQNLVNSLQRELNNDMAGGAGELFNDAAGYEIPITTLTQISRKITTQKYYDAKISDYVPVVVGEGAFSRALMTYKTGLNTTDFDSGLIRTGANTAATMADIQIEGDIVPIQNWKKALTYDIFELEEAGKTQVVNLISAKQEALKKTYDLGLIQKAFIGTTAQGNSFTGLVNHDMTLPYHVPVDAGVTIPVSISSMDAIQINTLVGALIKQYRIATGFTAYPDKFIIPTSDWFGLSELLDPRYPLADSSRYAVLIKAFRQQTKNPKFEIIDTPYVQAGFEKNGLLKDRYILTVNDPTSIKMLMPVPYTTTLPGTKNGMDWESVAYAQFSPVQFLRPAETQYFDLP